MKTNVKKININNNSGNQKTNRSNDLHWLIAVLSDSGLQIIISKHYLEVLPQKHAFLFVWKSQK